MLLKFAEKKDEMKLKNITCKRCGKESDLNPIGLCSECDTQVDYEYSLLYTAQTMDY
ncbi:MULTISPECIES: hypothetical protein [unclassified Fusibacter]|uniref:hypothetical protein n=1 Tax=unclassified Fusibacter TaxID=2624464 RepID=UPI0013E98B0A|nr:MULTISPECIES: hypothetical protein [unclassified Fusibacter]MCK8061028.1 hypothetical protein [Fusibacter sp. A2]NPE20518.1 hypothetical protein [Fusibacter sp. A1]